MPDSSAATPLLVVASLMLLHAAYSAYEHLSHLKALGRPDTSLPFDIVVECLVALVLGTVGGSLSAPQLKEISWASEMRKRSVDEMDSLTDFALFNNKGRAFFGPMS